MKYDINGIYSTKNDLEVKINQTGSRAMIREKGQEKATPRQGLVPTDIEIYQGRTTVRFV